MSSIIPPAGTPAALDANDPNAFLRHMNTTLKQVHAAQATGGVQGVNAAGVGDSFTTDPMAGARSAAAKLPLPRPSQRQALTPAMMKTYASTKDHIQTVLSSQQGQAAAIPLLPQNPNGTLDPKKLTPEAVQAAVGQLAKAGLSLNSDNITAAFLHVVVDSKAYGIGTLQSLTKALGSSRDMFQDQEIDQQKKYMKKSEDAQKKAAKAGIFSKVVAAVMMILTAVMVVCTMGAAGPFVLAAMAAAFLVTGLAKGKGHGGFDFDLAANVAMGVGGVASMANAAAGMLAKGALKVAEKQVATAVEKGATKGAARAGGQGGTEAGGAGAAAASETAAETAGKSTLTYTERLAAEKAARAAAGIPSSTAEAVAEKLAIATGKSVVRGVSSNTLVGGGMVASAALQAGTVASKTSATLAQNAADQESAKAQGSDIYVQLYQKVYKQTNDLVQTLTEQHQHDLDGVKTKLERDQAVNMAINRAVTTA